MPAPQGHEAYNVNVENQGGRPIKYDVAFIEQEAFALEQWMKMPDSLYFKKFAFDRGYSYQRLNEFAEINERFSVTLTRAREWQEIRLVEAGLKNEVNGNFCKFVMFNACGWTDKQETKLSGDAVNPLAFLLQKANGESKDLVNAK